MDGLTIESLMRKDHHVSPFFEGVFAADTLPHRLHKVPALLIANTDPISRPGSHWVAFYINEDKVGEFWDSYGMPPIVANHRKFLNRLCKKWTYNHTSLQAIDSKVCGEYCVLYLVHRAHGVSLHAFVKKIMRPTAEKTDQVVRKMFKHMFGHKKNCILPSTSQTCCERRQ